MPWVSDLECSVSALNVYPIKSCGGHALDASLLVETGLEFDRAWMVTDPDGHMLTQRELPRMALVTTKLRHADLVLRAPGMLALHLALDTVEAPTRAQVWKDTVRAFDMGPLAAQWFSDFLGRPLRLVRFDPDQKRLSPREWTGDIAAENAFADAFPLLVCSSASLADLNRRLAGRGESAVAMDRFRPNIVLDGLEAYDEDHIDLLCIDADGGPVLLKLVKPCTRCNVPSIDQVFGVQGHEPGDTLAGYRADARVEGRITFGMNAVLVDGVERVLRAGQRARATLGL